MTIQMDTVQQRLFISVSVRAVTKVLSRLRRPVSKLDTAVRKVLNVAAKHEGELGRPVVELSSAGLPTVLAYLDLRVMLDQSITNHDSRYTAALSMMAAKLSYENKIFVKTVVNHYWKMEFLCALQLWNDHQQNSSTYAIMLYDKTADLVIVAFKGTEFNVDTWITDINVEWTELPDAGKIHMGFMRALGQLMDQNWPKPEDVDPQYLGRQPAYYTIRQKLRDILMLDEKEKTKFIVTGHSLGGALAILFMGMLAYHDDTWLIGKLEGVYTFGQPRVGDEKFKEFMNKKIKQHHVKYLRYVYCNDVVPRLPFDNKKFKYKHFGMCLYFDYCYRGQLVGEEPNKNYFSWKWEIPKHLISIWELIRGFIIPYTKGPDYKEGWLMIALRLLGLLFPGLSAHSPQDYVNVTRLGTLPFNLQNIIHDPSFKM